MASVEEDSENLSMWSKKWKTGSIGWHRPKVHESLLKFENDLLPNKNSRVLVPLCGKTVDMAYLAQHENVQQVVGIDGIAKAMQAFSKEHPNLKVELTPNEEGSPFDAWKGESITLLRGDFFDLQREQGEPFDAVWDRGSLIAIDPSMREQYVNVLGRTIAPRGRILLATFVANKEGGPPYSMDEPLIRELYEGQPWVDTIQVISEHDALALESLFKAWIMWFMYGNVTEKIFLIQAK
jgi:thiopurine S-methyltransferase